ncbi:MAG TPA: PEP-CTERM sorting domain-containing protein [Verrucomicrobiae bacterium]|nr:PEP-CTERM sorting domain-containing protein [Verrucomicrobiae bacterium]
MKASIKTLLVIACAYTIASTPSFAQVYTFDEFGNSSGPGISPGVLQPDPSGGLPGLVLVYNLAFPVVTGDVALMEPGQPAPGPYSDVVRFWDPTGAPQSQIIFYSDVSATDPADAPADTGLPVQLIIAPTNPVFINEIGPEGNNGAIYTPGGAQGTIPGTVGLQYNIISDVPEPGTVALAILAGGTVLLAMKRRPKAN